MEKIFILTEREIKYAIINKMLSDGYAVEHGIDDIEFDITNKSTDCCYTEVISAIVKCKKVERIG